MESRLQPVKLATIGTPQISQSCPEVNLDRLKPGLHTPEASAFHTVAEAGTPYTSASPPKARLGDRTLKPLRSPEIISPSLSDVRATGETVDYLAGSFNNASGVCAGWPAT